MQSVWDVAPAVFLAVARSWPTRYFSETRGPVFPPPTFPSLILSLSGVLHVRIEFVRRVGARQTRHLSAASHARTHGVAARLFLSRYLSHRWLKNHFATVLETHLSEGIWFGRMNVQILRARPANGRSSDLTVTTYRLYGSISLLTVVGRLGLSRQTSCTSALSSCVSTRWGSCLRCDTRCRCAQRSLFVVTRGRCRIQQDRALSSIGCLVVSCGRSTEPFSQ